MKGGLLALLPLGFLQGDEPALPPPPPYAETMEVIVDRFERGEWDAAFGQVSGLIVLGTDLTEAQQAEAQYASGLILLHRALEARADSLLPGASDGEQAPTSDWYAAALAFGSARALAGPGELRRFATYDRGVAHLMWAEAWFSRIPEVAAQQAASASPGTPTPIAPSPTAPGMTGAPAVPGGPEAEDAPDPLELARHYYGVAKENLVQRLREDWRDEDTRANLEWIQRRLRELEEIERQREEQQQEKQDQDQEQDPDQDENQEENQDEGQDPEQDPESEDEEGQDESEPQESDESPEPSEGEEQEKQEPTETESAQPEQAQPPEEGQGEAESREPQPAERLLTREEVMRLLDKLAELEQEGEELEAMLQQARRVPVERDW